MAFLQRNALQILTTDWARVYLRDWAWEIHVACLKHTICYALFGSARRDSAQTANEPQLLVGMQGIFASTQGDEIMATVYVEARPKGRPEGSRIDDYVVETQADQVLGVFSTQKAAIDWAKANGHSPHVARVRHLNDKKRPDHWRAV
jgi:hypothetical protein